ncbi:PAS domain-containing protein [Niveispirillum fermenti]|uniref:PAS domain-containing protein n=1 Tax=Niveispirillum fermenti TaxID=1233113 RepID=UPI003A8521BE
MFSSADPIDAADLTQPPLRAALALWRRAAGGAALPLVGALDLAAIDRTLLPNLALVAGPADGHGRLFGLFMGSAAAIATGRDITGRFLDEVYPPALYDTAHRFLLAVAHGRAPVYEEFAAGPDAGRTVQAAWLGLPLAGPDGAVSRILLALDYRPSVPAVAAGVRVLQDRSRLHRHTVRPVRL